MRSVPTLSRLPLRSVGIFCLFCLLALLGSGLAVTYFDRSEGVSLSAVVLTFSLTPKPRLLFIDTIILSGPLSEYSITRRTFHEPAAAPPAAAKAPIPVP